VKKNPNRNTNVKQNIRNKGSETTNKDVFQN